MVAKFAVKSSTRKKKTTAAALTGSTAELLALSRLLLQTAQKYVPNTPEAYADAANVVQCAKQLEAISRAPMSSENFAAAVAETTARDIVVMSPEYRYLKTKAIAGLATIADLGTKLKNLPGKPTDFQNGMRLGYKRASEVAQSFLADIDTEYNS
jgi:hypothetical protein